MQSTEESPFQRELRSITKMTAYVETEVALYMYLALKISATDTLRYPEAMAYHNDLMAIGSSGQWSSF